jgi:hypothetical protein
MSVKVRYFLFQLRIDLVEIFVGDAQLVIGSVRLLVERWQFLTGGLQLLIGDANRLTPFPSGGAAGRTAAAALYVMRS